MARNTPEVRVLTSSEALAKARAEGEAYALRNPRPAVKLRRLGPWRLDHREIEAIARADEPMVQQLREIAGTSGAAAAAACVCLMRIGHADSAARLSELLASETSPAIGEFFTWIGMNGDVVGALPDLEALRRHVEPVAQNPDHPDRLPALHAAFALGTLPANTEIVETLVRAHVAKRLGTLWTFDALARIVRGGGDPGLAAARALLQPPFNDRSKNVRVAGDLRDPGILPDIERVLGSGPKKEVEGALLEALACIQGAEAIPGLLNALDDPELSHYAAAALADVAAGTGDEAIVAALTMAAATPGSFGEPAKAMAHIGGPLAMRTLPGAMKRAIAFDAMYCLWRVQGITVSDAIRRFVDAGVIPSMPSEAELSAVNDSADTSHHDVHLFWHYLLTSGHLVEALGEDGDATDAARHPHLLERYAGATGGKLPIESASQIDGPTDARDQRDTEIQFVCGDRVYQVTTRTWSRNFDLAAVRTLLNEALRDRGQPERFTRLHQRDCETLIFGPQAEVEAACDFVWLLYGTELKDYSDRWAKVQEMLLKAAGTGSRPFDPADIGFHIFRPTRAGTFPHDAVNAAVARALGSARSVAVAVGEGWTEILVPITSGQFTTLGAEAIEALFVSLCDTAEAHLGRTLCGSDWARIHERELARGIDAIDWLQYFGPRFGTWLRGRSPHLSARQSPRGAEVVKLDLDPLAPSWERRRKAAKRIGLPLRSFPSSAQEELDPEARLKRVLPPEPAAWKPEERQAMLRARAATLNQIEKGMANARLFNTFRRRYLADELESSRLDRIATWLPHYGSVPATAAFRSVARLHDAFPTGPPMDDIALEGCVKIVAWGGDDRPLLERELLMEHIVNPNDPGNASFVRAFPDRGAVEGLMKMTAMQVKACPCPRCAEVRKALAKGDQGR